MATLVNNIGRIYIESSYYLGPSAQHTWVYYGNNAYSTYTCDISSLPNTANIKSVQFTYDLQYDGGWARIFLPDAGQDVIASDSNILQYLKSLDSFTNLKIRFAHKGQRVVETYQNVPSNSKATWTNVVLKITYQAGSQATFSPTQVNVGSSTTMTLAIPLDVSQSDSIYHNVKWTLGDSTLQFVMSGHTQLSKIIQIPQSWLNQFPNSNSAVATCQVTTYVNNIDRGTNTYYITIKAGTLAAPSVTLSGSPGSSKISSSNSYYQTVTYCNMVATATLVGGATIKSCIISGSQAFSTSSTSLISSAQTGYFNNSGTHSYTITIIDSRNMTASASIQINVIAVSRISISKFSPSRYSIINEMIQRSTYGQNAIVSLSATYDRIGGYNSCSANILYKRNDQSTYTTVPIPSNYINTSTGVIQIADSLNAIFTTSNTLVPYSQKPAAKSFSSDYSFEFILNITDKIGTASATVKITTGRCNFHLSGSDYGVGIGMFSTATEDDPKLQVKYPSYFKDKVYGEDGTQIGKQTYSSYIPTQLVSPWNFYNLFQRPIVKRFGQTVTINAKIYTSTAISGSDDLQKKIFNIPATYRPLNQIIIVGQGPASHTFTIRINVNGDVIFTRYRNGGSYTTLNVGMPIQFSGSWIVGQGDSKYAMYPSLAMTSNSSESCVASCSTSYGSGYQAYKAFDHNVSNAWLSSSSQSSSSWLQLQMPQALFNICVEISARNSSNGNNPTAGTVQLSNDGSTWTSGTGYSGWSSSTTNGPLGYISCNNTTKYKYVRFNITSRAKSGHVDVGQMIVYGQR